MNLYNFNPLELQSHDVLVYYKGPFDDLILSKISDFLRNQFPGSPRLGKKVFSVFIELAQNISYYSAENNIFGTEEDHYGVGTVMIYENKISGKYVLTAGNLTQKKYAEQMTKRCKELNGMTAEELRALKKEIRSKPRDETQTGGNIGLVHIALKAQNPLVIDTHPTDDEHVFFSITTEVSKSI